MIIFTTTTLFRNRLRREHKPLGLRHKHKDITYWKDTVNLTPPMNIAAFHPKSGPKADNEGVWIN